MKSVVLNPTESFQRENPWDIYDQNWSAGQTRERRKEGGFGEGVVWTAMRRVGFGKEVRYAVVGEVAGVEGEETKEIVVG